MRPSSQSLLNRLKNRLTLELTFIRLLQPRWILQDIREIFSAPLESLECPICHHHAVYSTFKRRVSWDRFGGGRLLRHTCPNCGVVFGPQKMLELSEEELADEYRHLYSIYSEGDTTESELATFRTLNPTQEGVYLNFGSGIWSRSLPILQAEGYSVYGYEPNVLSHTDPTIITTYHELAPMRFDGIFSNNLIEHLQYPVDTFKFLSTILTDSGTIAHSTSCYEYTLEFSRFHLFFYTGNSMSVICERTGLTQHLTENPDIRLFTKVRSMGGVSKSDG